jgi:hypothetical protein
MDLLDLPPILIPKIPVDLIMTPVFVKIGMILAIVYLVTAVFICMIAVTVKQDGSSKKIFKNPNDRDGNVLQIQTLQMIPRII